MPCTKSTPRTLCDIYKAPNSNDPDGLGSAPNVGTNPPCSEATTGDGGFAVRMRPIDGVFAHKEGCLTLVR